MMPDHEYADWPEGYGTVDVATIDRVAYTPDGKAVILVTATDGLKVCFVAPLADLTRAIQQITANPKPGEMMRVPLRTISGGKDGTEI